jgi:hypothetical protein
MKKINVLVSLILLFAFAKVSGQKLSVNAALNKSGQQRMLCERMAKDYVIIGSNPKAKEAQVELDYSASIFNENFHELSAYAKSAETIDALNTVNELWAKFRVKVFKNPDIDNCPLVLAEAHTLLEACNTVVEKIQLDNNVEVARLTRLCGRQRMLTQRLAKLYMLDSWKVDYPRLNKEIDESINTFEYSLGLLMNYSENTPEIKTILNKQYDDWSKLKKDFEDRNTLKTDLVFKSTNAMLKDFDRATTLYEKIADEQKLQQLTNNVSQIKQ